MPNDAHSLATAARPVPVRARATPWSLAPHRWLGRVLMIYMLFVFATGTLLVFGDEIEAQLSPQMQQRGPVEPPAGYGRWYDAARAAYPDAQPTILRLPASPALAAAVEMRQGRDGFVAWADRGTAEVQGRTAIRGFREMVRLMHTTLMTDRTIGLLLVTSMSVLLAAQLVLGLLAQRRPLRQALRNPVAGPTARIRWAGLHRWAGIWALPVLTVTVVTGMFYCVEALGFTPDTPAPTPVSARDRTLPGTLDGAALDRAVAVAQAQLPGLDVREIYLPTSPGDSLRIRGHLTAALVRPRANTVTLDPADLSVLGVFRGEDLSVGRRIAEAADPLHYGTFAGTPSRVIWLIGGCLGLLLAMSGMSIAAWRLAGSGRRSYAAAFNGIFLPARIATVLALAAVAVLFAIRLP